ncbi:MAG: PAS domain S-box protein [Methanoregula sp.]|nr:PAS domain S-box protein [Methanoregula sp.]
MEGLTLGDISKHLEINRVSLSKYLATMVARGEIEYRSIGRAKLYTLTKRIPFESILGQTEDHVIITDNDGRVTQIEERTAALYACPRELIIGKSLGEGSTYRFFSSDGSPLSARQMTETGSGELLLYCGDQITCFQVKSIPVVLNDGSRGNACILTDITEKKCAEEALQESEAKYQRLANSVTNMLFAFDQTLKYTYWNKTLERVTGIPAKDAIGKSLSDLFPDIKGTQAEQVFLDVLRTQKQRSFITDYPLAGKTHFFEIDCYSSADGLSVFARDITERKLAEEALQESERKYRTLIENIPGRIFLKDTASVYISCNDNYARDLGIAAGTITGKTDFDFFPHDLAEKYRTDDRRVIESGVEESFEEQYTVNDAKYWVKTIKAPVLDDAGKITGILGMFHDITRQNLAEDAMWESEEKYRTLVETMNEGLLAVDNNCNITFVNNRYCEIVGYSLNELIGKPSVMLNAPECTNVAQAQWDMRMRGNSGSYLIRLIRKDGQKINALAAARPIYDENGQLNGSLIVVTDLTPLEKTSISRLDDARHVQQ